MQHDAGFSTFEKYGWTREQMTGFVVEQLRRYRPMVAVGHDLNGEYGHYQHRAYALLLSDAVRISADPAQYPESAQAYGVWDVPKTYLHLYPENPICMDWDQPMENFGGMTPYEVTKNLGFKAHRSQQSGWSWYFSIYDTAASIEKYSPCEYGLYRTTAGDDVRKDDMFENLTSHAEQDRLEAEARKEAEEQARREAEEASAAAEAAAHRAEEEVLQETERIQAQEKASQEEARHKKPALLIPGAAGAITLAVIVSVIRPGVSAGKFAGSKNRKK